LENVQGLVNDESNVHACDSRRHQTVDDNLLTYRQLPWM
jgi:hypothetical protein